MAKPSEKAPELEKFLESTFGRTTNISKDTCASCHGPATDLRDEGSRKEYTISGLCQSCRDSVFGT